MKLRQWMPAALAMAIVSPTLVQASTDVDIDNDGLIEISTLEQLDLMRYDLAGTSLNGDSTGCPATGCNGYELVADLDFDTNGNGVADEGDLFWNDGKGWTTVFVNYKPFTAVLDGNGHVISNLFIRGQYEGGVFDYLKGATIKNIEFSNVDILGYNAAVISGSIHSSYIENISITGNISGNGGVGGIGSHVVKSNLKNIRVNADISNTDEFGVHRYVGGVAASSKESVFSEVKFSGESIGHNAWISGGIVGMSFGDTIVRNAEVTDAYISSTAASGGIIGDSFATVTIENSFFSGQVVGSGDVAPIIADSLYTTDVFIVNGSYWDSEVSGIYTSDFGQPRTTSELKCPTMPGDAMCDASLYADWDETIWDFGTSSDYPVLR